MASNPLAKVHPPDPARSTPAERRAFMVENTRNASRDLALEHLLAGAPDNERQLEQFNLVSDFGIWARAPHAEIIAVANAEWAAALRYAAGFLEQLRQRLWPMCRAQMPDDVILAAAEALQRRHWIAAPPELLLPFVTRIWRAAKPYQPRSPRRR